MYDYVRPGKVLGPLMWLRANNHLYQDIDVNTSWVADAANDCSELWSALSQGTVEPMDEHTTDTGRLQ